MNDYQQALVGVMSGISTLAIFIALLSGRREVIALFAFAALIGAVLSIFLPGG